MLKVSSNEISATCEGSSRREFLRIGTLGLGGLALTDLLSLKTLGSESNRYEILRNKSVVFLNLQGGPTHVETFDPKMTAPSEYRAMFGEVKTSLPGVTFGHHFPFLGKLAHKMAVVRSFRHGNGSHGSAAALVAAGGNSTGACMGSLFSRVAGITNHRTGLPNNCVVVPATCGEKYAKLNNKVDRITSVGNLSKTFSPFDPSKGGEILNDMELRLPKGRFDNRRGLLSRIDDLKRSTENSLSSASSLHQKAFDVILGGVTDAFDLSKEDPRLVQRYDTSAFVPPKHLAKKKKNGKAIPAQSPVALGKQMLMARRLCEAGCGFVTVTSTGWDMHGNAFGIDDGMPVLGPAVDKAASAFIEDCAKRGLSEKILLVISGEFGRTPKINNRGGRDHWGNLCTLAFAGGGLKMGQVVGKSDKLVGQPAEDLVTTEMLRGTLMHTLFDPGQVRLLSGIPSDVQKAVVDAKPIPQLI